MPIEPQESDIVLDLRTLADGTAVTPARGASFAEAAAVCLESQRHAQDVRLDVDVRLEGNEENRLAFPLRWPPVTEQMAQTYADPDEAVEDGAYGVAILLVCRLTGRTNMQRSRKGTGFDYWVGFPEPARPFQKMARLEVSGLLRGSDSQINNRTAQKRRQTERSDNTGLPAYIVIVEFGRPKAKVAER